MAVILALLLFFDMASAQWLHRSRCTGLEFERGTTNTRIDSAYIVDSLGISTLPGGSDTSVVEINDTLGYIDFAILSPHAMPDTNSVVFSNGTDDTLTILEVIGWSDRDNFSFMLKSATESGGSPDTIVSDTITTNGTSLFYTGTHITAFDDSVLLPGDIMIYRQSADSADYVHLTVKFKLSHNFVTIVSGGSTDTTSLSNRIDAKEDSSSALTWPDTLAKILTVSDTTSFTARFLAREDSSLALEWPDTLLTILTVSDTTSFTARILARADSSTVLYWADTTATILTVSDTSSFTGRFTARQLYSDTITWDATKTYVTGLGYQTVILAQEDTDTSTWDATKTNLNAYATTTQLGAKADSGAVGMLAQNETISGTWALGTPTVTTLNNVTIDAPASSATLRLATGSSLITYGANSITLTSTGATNVTLPTAGTIQGCAAEVTPASTGTMTVTITAAKSVFTITPTGNCTFNASGGVAGQRITFIVYTSGTSSYTLTWSSNFKSTGTLATGTVDKKYFCVEFVCQNGTLWCETSRTVAM